MGSYVRKKSCEVSLDFTFIYPCIASISLKDTQQDATFPRSIYFYKLLYMFQVVPPHIIRSKSVLAASGTVKPILLHAASWMRWKLASIPSTIGLTIPDAICTVFCSWWWAEEPSETCRAIYRNKWIEKTLHLVGCSRKFCRMQSIHSQSLYIRVYFTICHYMSRWQIVTYTRI